MQKLNCISKLNEVLTRVNDSSETSLYLQIRKELNKTETNVTRLYDYTERKLKHS